MLENLIAWSVQNRFLVLLATLVIAGARSALTDCMTASSSLISSRLAAVVSDGSRTTTPVWSIAVSASLFQLRLTRWGYGTQCYATTLVIDACYNHARNVRICSHRQCNQFDITQVLHN